MISWPLWINPILKCSGGAVYTAYTLLRLCSVYYRYTATRRKYIWSVIVYCLCSAYTAPCSIPQCKCSVLFTWHPTASILHFGLGLLQYLPQSDEGCGGISNGLYVCALWPDISWSRHTIPCIAWGCKRNHHGKKTNFHFAKSFKIFKLTLECVSYSLEKIMAFFSGQAPCQNIQYVNISQILWWRGLNAFLTTTVLKPTLTAFMASK